MQFYLNDWAYDARSPTLKPTSAPSANTTYTFNVLSASVADIADNVPPLVPNGSDFAVISPETIGIYRFFSKTDGTHFLTASTSEEKQILATRHDLVFEGIGLDAVNPANLANDPNATPVYRFFDKIHGTHFFTASQSEEQSVLATRPDLTFEGLGFYEHSSQQSGDEPVYRFFDTHYGTHFYTGSLSEDQQILATRPDLKPEGIAFYAPTT